MSTIRNSGAGDIEKKLKALWADKRSFCKRLALAGSAMAAACFTFIFFGPVEMVAFSGDFLTYSYKDILGLMAVGALLAFVAGTAVISLLKGKLFNYVVTFISAATIGGYLQALALNGSLGSLNGDAISWDLMKGELFVNLFVWSVVFLAAYGILYFSRDLWKKVVVFSSILLIAMQAAPMIGILTGMYEDSRENAISEYALMDTGMYEFSVGSNILVFVLDRMDFDYMNSAMEADPSILDGLEGFTGYTNAISKYSRTKPALNQLLTGSELVAYEISDDAFLKDSWTHNGRNLLGDLTEQGYQIEIYASIQDLFSDPGYVCEYVSNVTTDKGDINNFMVLRKLLYLSAYRYAPLSMKPFFWADTNFYNSQAYVNSRIYELDDAKYAPGFANSTANREQNCFKFYHFNGPHEPFLLNADGTRSDHFTSAEEQMMGTLHNLYTAFDALKQQGVYENATIIITADHGNAVHDDVPLTKPMSVGLFFKPAGSVESPLLWSSAPVSTDNIPATIIQAAGGNSSLYGDALDEVPEDFALVREFYKSVEEGKATGSVYKYEVIGDAADFENWINVAVSPMQYSFY